MSTTTTEHSALLDACLGPQHRDLRHTFQVGDFVVATDGEILAAVPGNGAREHPQKSVAEAMAGWLSEEPGEGTAFDLPTLRSALFGAARSTACRCHCGHEHTREAANIVAWSFGHHDIDARRLATLLEHAPGETVTIHPGPHAEAMIHVTGEGWRGILMPLRDIEREVGSSLEDYAS